MRIFIFILSSSLTYSTHTHINGHFVFPSHSLQFLITYGHAYAHCPNDHTIPDRAMICIDCARFRLAKVPLSIVAIQLYPGDHVAIQVLIQQPVGKWFLSFNSSALRAERRDGRYFFVVLCSSTSTFIVLCLCASAIYFLLSSHSHWFPSVSVLRTTTKWYAMYMNVRQTWMSARNTSYRWLYEIHNASPCKNVSIARYEAKLRILSNNLSVVSKMKIVGKLLLKRKAIINFIEPKFIHQEKFRINHQFRVGWGYSGWMEKESAKNRDIADLAHHATENNLFYPLILAGTFQNIIRSN